MKKTLLAVTCLSILVGCKTTPTGRKQIAMYSDTQMNQMGSQSFEQLKKQLPINHDEKVNRYVRCITDNVIATLPSKYAKQTWEVVVFEEPSANAFALPGGKIGVHTGLLKIAENQHQLATVIGHEVGHVIAEHSNERASHSAAIQVAAQSVSAVSKAYQNQYHQETMALFGISTQYGFAMPYSRLHESEADQIGLELMAKAGFNPKQSVTLWQNMAKGSSQNPPEFFSTHPSPSTRIDDLRKQMPAAMNLNKAAIAQNKRPHCLI